ncbi:hypothetical protein [Chryseosolibacter indicus]|uniref:Uncharacterized protein n=1 Tax=Chryseosolibacter indicus TaxID=2782351 RepID=A0ABS5VUQ8_9BACT|nr:hypothetical protein [Chryseosolibacter indicus]MBT1704624.1 hypothetical protein [Chryseosolibacter indicus]
MSLKLTPTGVAPVGKSNVKKIQGALKRTQFISTAAHACACANTTTSKV